MFRFVSRGWRALTMPQVSMKPELYEEERRARLAEERERLRTRQDALQQARQKSGPLKLGDTEAQLKRVSEEVTMEAAEKKKRH
ncbi:hypothetical protein [Dictyobacter aurantiacus]|uniref:Uncharacterized protein n=1 Tax=Dictyobacter aurantiacus TaxID=1936993 RepID=A0A401ZMC2_9CHLR|nr:hypothetical protein [Dictyobacter aurantiacus]GCE07964.1 hypothetical protein KDAU_52930 [Dictyobacter aurantiacus]